MTTHLEIQDNFLPVEYFEFLHNELVNHYFPWYSTKIVNDTQENRLNNLQFVHIFYHEHSPISGMVPILQGCLEKIKPISVYKVKANLMPCQNKIVEHGMHIDVEDEQDPQLPFTLPPITTSILYMNTNDGYTKFEDGTIVKSVQNRFVTFPNYLKHTGTTTSDSEYRMVINFNYV